MKKVFRFKEGELLDSEDIMDYILGDISAKENSPSGIPISRKNWKVTIIIEEEK